MEIEIRWQGPISLIDGTDEKRVYTPEDESLIPDCPGVYVFARKRGETMIPLYMGRATRLAVRISQQLNSVELMKGIENSPQGRRVLIVGQLQRKPGQPLQRALRIAEAALIEHSLSQGFDILNKLGKSRPAHSVWFAGNREVRAYSGNEIKTRANR